MRILLCLLAALASVPASAEKLTLDRIHADPALAGPGVRNLRVSPDGERVTFLRGRPDNQFQLDLWEYNMKDKSTCAWSTPRRWRRTSAVAEEQARRERARTASLSGILNYSWSPDGKQLLVPISGDLYLVDAARPDGARKVASGNVADPKISPKGRYVSFVRKQNLFVIDLSTGAEKQLTTDGGGTVFNGEAEFVAQEEMGQTTGYYWAPDDSAIAYKRFDEAPVPVARRFEIFADRTDVSSSATPPPATRTCWWSLMIVSPTTGAQRKVDLGAEPDIYLVRADWSADSRSLLYQVQTRDQKRLDLIAVDAATLAQRTLLTETSKTWVSIHDDLQIPAESQGLHLGVRAQRPQPPVPVRHERQAAAPDLERRMGHRQCAGGRRKGRRVYVASNRDAVVDKQVYALRLDGSTPTSRSASPGRRLARGAFCAQRRGVSSTPSPIPSTPPKVSIRRPDGAMIGWVEEK
jgi:dipeptidyl-peptidase-4